MMRADAAEVIWNPQEKMWVVRIKFGEEVIRRPVGKSGRAPDMADDALRTLAAQTASDEGYEVLADAIAIKR